MPRELRLSRRRTAPVPDNSKRITELMKSISKLHDEMAAASTKVATESAELLALMKAQHLTSFDAGAVHAEITRSAGKSSNYIDPVKFRAKVKDDKEFYSAISVSVTAARKVLPERALAAITTTTPGKPGPEVVKVTHGQG